MWRSMSYKYCEFPSIGRFARPVCLISPPFLLSTRCPSRCGVLRSLDVHRANLYCDAHRPLRSMTWLHLWAKMQAPSFLQPARNCGIMIPTAGYRGRRVTVDYGARFVDLSTYRCAFEPFASASLWVDTSLLQGIFCALMLPNTVVVPGTDLSMQLSLFSVSDAFGQSWLRDARLTRGFVIRV